MASTNIEFENNIFGEKVPQQVTPVPSMQQQQVMIDPITGQQMVMDPATGMPMMVQQPTVMQPGMMQQPGQMMMQQPGQMMMQQPGQMMMQQPAMMMDPMTGMMVQQPMMMQQQGVLVPGQEMMPMQQVTNITQNFIVQGEQDRRDADGNIIHPQSEQLPINITSRIIWNSLGDGKNCQIGDCERQAYKVCDQVIGTFGCNSSFLGSHFKGCNRRMCINCTKWVEGKNQLNYACKECEPRWKTAMWKSRAWAFPLWLFIVIIGTIKTFTGESSSSSTDSVDLSPSHDLWFDESMRFQNEYSPTYYITAVWQANTNVYELHAMNPSTASISANQTFRVVDPLSGAKQDDFISFESVQNPGLYIREADWLNHELYVGDKLSSGDSSNFEYAATFKVIVNEAGVYNFQSKDYPTYYLGPLSSSTTQLGMVNKYSSTYQFNDPSWFSWKAR